MVDASAAIRAADSPIHDVIETFRRWMFLPDPDVILAVLTAVAANRMDGDPVWLLIVGPPGGGKTEILQATAALPEVHRAGVLTEASLLSGTPKKEVTNGAKGGLLKEIGSYGVLSLKDFGSVLSQRHEQRAGLLAALREIYDGEWTRHIGSDGGRRLHWHGKLGLIGGCTPVIDSHHAVMASLGERFAFYRLTVDDTAAQAMSSLGHMGQETMMRDELGQAVTRLFDTVDTTNPPALSDTDKQRLVSVATLVVECRSAVERDGYSREITFVPPAEAPGRLVAVLARILTGARLLGASSREAWRITEKVALDSMPAQRLQVLRYMLTVGEAVNTKTVGTELGLPTQTTRRILEDLAAHRVIIRHGTGGSAGDSWSVAESTLTRSRNLHNLYIPANRISSSKREHKDDVRDPE